MLLLCTMVQGVKADDGWDVWNGKYDFPYYSLNTYGYIDGKEVLLIRSFADLLTFLSRYDNYYTSSIYLDKDIDVSKGDWTQMSTRRYSSMFEPQRALKDYPYTGTFYGNGHTIRFRLNSDEDNCRGFFDRIGEGGRVQDLHVECSIDLDNSRLVGGICGENYGTISNCWVSGHVNSGWTGSGLAKVGGIVGENHGGTVEYCCVTANVSNKDDGVGGIAGSNYWSGNIKHCTFYGNLTVEPGMSNDNKWAGDENPDGEEHLYDAFSQDEYDAANGKDVYRDALQHPYRVTVNASGPGTVTADYQATYPNNTVTLSVASGTVASVTITDADGNNVPLKGQNIGSSYWFAMPNKDVTATVVFYYDNWATSGTGTEGDPYLISNAEQWDRFAYNVGLGRSFSGEFIKLAADIRVTSMAGTREGNRFCGTFDGDGHTLTCYYNSLEEWTGAVVAPFRTVNNATIKNLKTAGAITTDAMCAAGIVGDVTGSLSLTNCCSAVTISSSRSDADFHGGLVASNNGSVTISGCVFDGSFVATVAHTNQYGTTFCGGLVGYCGENTSTTITNSLVAPTNVSEGMVRNTFVGYNDGSSTLNITNSYFVATDNLPGNEGTQAVAAATATANLGALAKDYGMVKAYQNGIFYDGTYYMVPATLSGSGTELAPYTISSLYEWNSFAYHVNNGITYSGQYVKLTEDISIVTMAGVSETSGFRGTFDGAGHTLTFNATGQTEKFIAPFRCVGGSATIKNLQTAGCISTSNMYATGLIASIEKSNENSPSITVENCRSSMAINNSGSGDMAISGLVGRIEGATLTIRGCVFDGSLVGRGATGNAGFVSWTAPNSNVTIEDCLFVPTNISTSTDQCATIARKDDDASAVSTIINCYYTQAYGTEQGRQAVSHSTVPTGLGDPVHDYGMVKAYNNGILSDGTYYGAPATITLDDDADNSTAISDADGFVASVTLTGRTLYKDGDWNTLCLPFSLDHLTGTPLDKATVKTLASTSFTGSTLTMNFTENLNAIEAGKPYIVRWEPVDLSKLTANYTAQDGEVLTGTLSGIYKISIAPGATVKLQDVTINGKHDYWADGNRWAGINCIGDATIILNGTNNVRGFNHNYPGIHVAVGSTLTIKGSGTLNASSNGFGTGIGGGDEISCGNIVIEGGIINATGGGLAAGIGSGPYGDCGDITITDGVTKVTARRGENNEYSIGKGYEGTCGTVTIGGVEGAVTVNNYTYTGTGSGSVDVVYLSNLIEPVFTNVTISDATANVSTDYVDFVGTYSPVSIYTDEKTNLYLGAGNKLYYPTDDGFKVNACRGYFRLKQGLKAGDSADPNAGVRAFVLNFGEDDATGIISVHGSGSMVSGSDAWYTLDGRRLSQKPSRAGVYINKGKKVVIK